MQKLTIDVIWGILQEIYQEQRSRGEGKDRRSGRSVAELSCYLTCSQRRGALAKSRWMTEGAVTLTFVLETAMEETTAAFGKIEGPARTVPPQIRLPAGGTSERALAKSLAGVERPGACGLKGARDSYCAAV